MPPHLNSLDFTDSLRKWIQPQHLTAESLADINRQFNGREERYAVVDNFIDPGKLQIISRLMSGEGEVETVYKIFNVEPFVDKQKFDSVLDSQRFIYEDIYRGPRKGEEMTQPVLHDIMFRMQIKSGPFAAWLAAVTGLPIGAMQNANLKRLKRDHFLRWHGDHRPGRVLCLVLYLHQDWQPAFGGRLLMQRAGDGGSDAIDPLFNRLVLFDTNVRTLHAVEPMTDAAVDWSRLNYSVWFTEP